MKNLSGISNQQLYENVKSAASIKGKVDLLSDLIFKVIINDIHALERKVDKILFTLITITSGAIIGLLIKIFS